jgi:hypothetical protein
MGLFFPPFRYMLSSVRLKSVRVRQRRFAITNQSEEGGNVLQGFLA